MKRIYLENGLERVLHIVREDVDYFISDDEDGDWSLYIEGVDKAVISFGAPTAEEDARDALRAIGVLLGMEEKA